VCRALQKEDLGALKWQNAELESRAEMYQAQLSKLALSLERADNDKAQLEKDLAEALEAKAKGDNAVGVLLAAGVLPEEPWANAPIRVWGF
jgi:hypothetical protein